MLVPITKRRSRLPPWVQITAFDALDDPSAITDGSTGVANGVVSFQSKDTGILQLDGIREDIPIYARTLLDLVPDFDPLQDVLDLRLDIAAMPLGAAKYGPMIFVTDGPVSGRATWNGAGVHCYPNSATVVNAGIIGATAQGTGTALASNTNPATAILGRLWWHGEAQPTVRVAGALQRSGAENQPLTVLGASGPAFAGALGTWKVCVALQHVSAVDATDNVVQVRAFVRRLRAGGMFS